MSDVCAYPVRGEILWGADTWCSYLTAAVLSEANTLAVIADGAVSAGLVYAQPEKAEAYGHSYFIDTKKKDVSKYAKQYLSSILTKVIYPK